MVLLNCLPPFPNHMPSAGLSILKSYLEHHDIPAEIAYWNLELSFRLKDQFNLPESALFPLMIALLHRLLPKLDMNNTLKAYLTAEDPVFFTSDEKIKEAAKFIHDYVKEELSSRAAYKLFGLSAKHDQWLSSIPFSAIIRELFPDAHVIVGGFQRKSAARSYLKINPFVDFTCWGEGEAPLKSLFDYCAGENRSGDLPPGIVERYGKQLRTVSGGRENISPLRENLFPVFDDYSNTVRGRNTTEVKTISFPIDGIRGCSWNRCRFCTATGGVRYSERSPESIAKEMLHQYKRHGINRFYFTDDDTGGGSRERLKRLASAVSSSKIPGIECTAWINPAGLDMEVFDIMKRSGFSCLKTGNEADSDNLLRKMDKKSRFADNILFLKASARFGIRHDGGIPLITGVPDETADDITESIQNLRLLRFFLGKDAYHSFNSFDLSRGSRYYHTLDAEERSHYSINLLGEMLPRRLFQDDAESEFLQYKRKVPLNAFLWQQFKRAHDHYAAAEYSFVLDRKKDDRYEYREYVAGLEIARIDIDPASAAVLRHTDDRVVSFLELKQTVPEEIQITPAKPNRTMANQNGNILISAVQKLKEASLLYASSDYTQIISVLDAGKFSE